MTLTFRALPEMTDRSTAVEASPVTRPGQPLRAAVAWRRPDATPLFLYHDRALRRVERSAISTVATEGRYVYIQAGACRFRVRGSLGDVVEQLGGHPFLQVNRNLAVNLYMVQRVDHQTLQVDGQAVVLSRCFRAALLQELTILEER